MTYTTSTNEKIVCDNYHAFMVIAKQYFPHIKLTAWRLT